VYDLKRWPKPRETPGANVINTIFGDFQQFSEEKSEIFSNFRGTIGDFLENQYFDKCFSKQAAFCDYKRQIVWLKYSLRLPPRRLELAMGREI
jgi:hypothetical protein